MKQKRKLVLLAILSISFTMLSQISCKSQAKETTSIQESHIIKLNQLGELTYPEEIEVRNDIPFALLIDDEFKNKFGDTVDYEVFRPNYVFLKKDFNEKDSLQLKDFGCILVSVLENPDKPYKLDNQFIDKIVASTSQSLKGTNYKISTWESLNSQSTLPDGTMGVELEYKQINTKTKKILNVISLYLLKDGKLININMSAPYNMGDEWKEYYKEIVGNLKLK